MPAKDIYHDTVRNALIKAGWTITDDPLVLPIGSRSTYIDLGAEKLIAAQRDAQKIAVEVKSFISPSLISDLEKAWGQFFMYSRILQKLEPDRQLYLAVNRSISDGLFNEEVGKLLLDEPGFRMIVFDPSVEEIIQWIP
jgi:XisH protein